MRALRQAWLAVANYVSWLLFALGGLLLNVGCAPFLLLPRRESRARATRRIIRALFDLWVKYDHACGAFRLVWHGPAPLPSGCVYVANHPSLIDAPVLLARLPEAFCIFKPALLRNPVIAPAALLAGYCAGDAGVDTVRDAAARLGTGCSLLVFPEGTRTAPGTALGPLRPGFALIARRAGVPVQVLLIRASRHLAPRGRAWWRLPELPASMEITVGPRFDPADFASTVDLVAAVERWLAAHARPVPA